MRSDNESKTLPTLHPVRIRTRASAVVLLAAANVAACSGAGEREFSGPGDGGTDAAASIDLPEDFGASCALPEECESGLCVEGPDGPVCTTACDGVCPEDYECLAHESGGLVCMPSLARLCRPCRSDDECRRDGVIDDPSRCVAWGDPGSFCGVRCDSQPCPGGYVCEPVTVEGGQAERHCLPDHGQPCACRPSWVGQGFETSCMETNVHGSCAGSRGCTPGGLTSCSGGTPSEEVCDGVDNNCNSATDEDTCNDGLTCTGDVCNGGEGCDNPLKPGKCLIEGLCRSSGDADPENPCQVCDPAKATDAWSPKTGACDDGDPCTTGDTCSGGVCSGEPVSSDTHEPNETPDAATALTDASDCDDYPSTSVTGTVFGPGDVDWYTYHLADESFCWIFPRAELTVPSGGDHDLCLFVDCDNGASPTITCKAGTFMEESGMRGCCSHTTGSDAEDVHLDHSCDGGMGTDDSAQVYVRVVNGGSTYTCDEYTLVYGDD